MFVSAGAYAREIDLSLYAETLTNTIVGIAHTFNKGVIGVATLITDLGALEETFGTPINPTTSNSAYQGWAACKEYLKKGNKLYVTRCDSTATPATYAAQSVQGSCDQYLATDVDGLTSIPAVKTLTSVAVNFTVAGVLAGDVIELHDVATPADNGFYVITLVAAGVVTVDRNWPVGTITSDFTVWTSQKEGGEDGATSVAATREFTSATATFTTNGVVAGDILSIHEPAGDIGDNGLYDILSVDSQTKLTLDRDFPTGSLGTLAYTIYSNNSRGADGSTAVAGEFSSAGAEFALHLVQAGDILHINDVVDTGDNGYYLITGLKLGSTDTTVEVNNAAWTAGALVGLTYEILPGSVTFQAASKGTWCTGDYITTSRNAGDKDNFDLETRDTTNTIQIEKVYNLDRAGVVASMLADSSVWTAVVRTNRGEPCPGKSFTVSGGNDGYTGIVDADYIGSAPLNTGINSFHNPEKIDVNLVLCPGVTSQNVQDALINLCESRGDCMTILETPDWATIDSVQDALDWHNGSLVRTTALNSSYAALYWAWQQVYDEYHDQDPWVSPVGHMAGVYTYNDNVQAPWISPAGLKRGKLTGSKDVRYSPSQNDRESLSGPGANINPIVNFVGLGIHAWGDKTLYRTTSALQDVPVRRMLLYVKKVIATAARILIFDPNDEVLDREFFQLVDPVLADVLARRGIRKYGIVSATTDDDRENHKAVYKMFIKPTKTARIIDLQFRLTSQGADFQELVV